MSDPKRLLSAESDDFEKELLGSWNAEQPSDAARARVLAAVGLGLGAATVATKAGAAAGGSIAPKAAAGTAALLKWLAVGIVGVAGVAAMGAAVQYARRARPAVPPPTATVAAPVAAPPTPLTAPALPTAEAPAPSAPLELPRAAPRTVATAHPRASASASAALGDQVSALDRARRALAAGDSGGALRELDAYEARFPRGALVEEAEVLRVEALIASGDHASAARVGARFLSAHPSSPHAARIHALLDAGP